MGSRRPAGPGAPGTHWPTRCVWAPGLRRWGGQGRELRSGWQLHPNPHSGTGPDPPRACTIQWEMRSDMQSECMFTFAPAVRWQPSTVVHQVCSARFQPEGVTRLTAGLWLPQCRHLRWLFGARDAGRAGSAPGHRGGRWLPGPTRHRSCRTEQDTGTITTTTRTHRNSNVTLTRGHRHHRK